MTVISYTVDEANTISNTLKSEGFCTYSWENDDLKSIKNRIKNHYLTQQHTICPYCRRNLQTSNGRYWDIEHIIPRSSAPQFMFEPYNLCISCVDCNSAKSDKMTTTSKAKLNYPLKASLFLIVHPHLDNYSDYITVVKEGFLYIGKTKKGIKTIEICNLNRFYDTAGFGAGDSNDELIFSLTSALMSTTDKKAKLSLRHQIIQLAIQGIT